MKRIACLLLLLASCSRREPPALTGMTAAAQDPVPSPVRASREGVRRGPYVQVAGPGQARVCFETWEETEGAVNAGGKRLAGPRARKHAILLEGLEVGAKVDYAIEPGGLRGSFRMPPGEDGEVFFVLWGDSRTWWDKVARIAARAAADAPDFTVHTGDLVDDGDVEEDWDHFFAASRPLLSSGAFWPAMGNHEEGSKIYLDLFHLPPPERWYSFRWGPAEFFVLDLNYGMRDNPGQAAWLKNGLAASTARFKFVMTHYPVLSGSYAGFGGGEDGEFAPLRRLVEEHRVTALLQGHNHNYQRHERNGVVYLTSGGAGAPLYQLGEGGPDRKAAVRVNHYVRVRLKGKTCSFEAVDIDGTVIDRREVDAR